MKIFQVTFGDIRKKADGYLLRGYLMHKILSEEHTVMLHQLDGSTSFARKIYNITLGAFFSVRKIRDCDAVLVEGSMLVSYAIIARLIRRKILFDPQGAIAYLGKNEKMGFYNTFARLMIGNLLDMLVSGIADEVLFVSSDDMCYFNEHYGTRDKCNLVRLSVDTDVISICNCALTSRNLFFMGNLRAIQNRTAAEFIVFKLAEQLPDHRIFIVGAGEESFKSSSRSNVTFTGFVGDYAEIACGCSMLINPVISGTGVKTKILEALAAGIPVLTTNLGVEGLIGAEEILEKGLLVSDIENFSAKVLQLEQRLKKIDRSMLRNYVENNHSLRNMREDMKKVLAMLNH